MYKIHHLLPFILNFPSLEIWHYWKKGRGNFVYFKLQSWYRSKLEKLFLDSTTSQWGYKRWTSCTKIRTLHSSVARRDMQNK